MLRAMDLLVNGEKRQFDGEELTLSELLTRMDIAQRRGIAVAVNYEVVPKSSWDDAKICDGDEIEIVRATQGG